MAAILKKVIVPCALVALWCSCGPMYPECETDENCVEHNEYCVDQLCRKCRDASHCEGGKNPCVTCNPKTYMCEKKVECCARDTDCPSKFCLIKPGKTTGKCGQRCRKDDDCAKGHRCDGDRCLPLPPCESDADCGPGQKCLDKYCKDVPCNLREMSFKRRTDQLEAGHEEVMRKSIECMERFPDARVKITLCGPKYYRGKRLTRLLEKRKAVLMDFINMSGVRPEAVEFIFGEKDSCKDQENKAFYDPKILKP